MDRPSVAAFLVAAAATAAALTGGCDRGGQASPGDPPEAGAAPATATLDDSLPPEQVYAAFVRAVEAHDADALFPMMDPDLAERGGVTLQVLRDMLSGPDLPEGWDTFRDQSVAAVATRGDTVVLSMQRSDGTAAPAFALRHVDGTWRVLGQRF